MHKIKWGIIGLGKVAHQFASQFDAEEAVLTGVASRTLQKAYDFASIYHIKKAYGSYEELAFDPEIDILYIATPNHSHYADILMALKAGKHVFCEKPITLNKHQLDEVLSLAQSRDLLVSEAMTIYHMPIYKKIKHTIETGKYGKLKMIHAQLGVKQTMEPTNRFYDPNSGGGTLMDIGVYAFSFIRYFLSGPPSERYTTVSMSKTGVDEASAFLFRTDYGEIATAAFSFQADMSNTAVLVCEKARISINDFKRADQALVTYSDGSTEEIRTGSSAEALTYEINAITQTLLAEENRTSLGLTQDVNELIDWAARKWHMSWALNEDH